MPIHTEYVVGGACGCVESKKLSRMKLNIFQQQVGKIVCWCVGRSVLVLVSYLVVSDEPTTEPSFVVVTRVE